MKSEYHFIKRSGWLRASVLGINDGILSTTSLAIGVVAASATRDPLMLATLAAVVAGAFSMAAGEYVSVSSQLDIETADLAREKSELDIHPDIELEELTQIYRQRGLSKKLANKVAKELTRKNALEAHARDELGINEISQAKPFQAALASAASFVVGGALPLSIAVLAPLKHMLIFQYGFALFFLAASGTLAGMIGGSSVMKSVLRICLWGTFAMFMSALIGYLFGVSMH